MSWWGKLVGSSFGFMLGGPLGAVVGAALGHNFDVGLRRIKDQAVTAGEFDGHERTQMAFFTTTFSVMGHIAKSDGRVTQDEILLANSVMQQLGLNEELRRAAQKLFNEGKRSDFPLVDVLTQFRKECRRHRSLLRMFLEIQIQAAYADEQLDSAERRLLMVISERLGFSRTEFENLLAMARAERHYRQTAGPGNQGPSLSDAYALLELQPSVSDPDLKRAYRRLMSQHHPDKLVAKGLPEEMMKVATEKTQEIQAAYERIREHRKLN